MTTHDPVDHPAHYTSHPAHCKCGEPIECIQVTEHLSFSVGNAIKYLWRAGLKDTSPAGHLQDLLKAQWYISREIYRINTKHS